MVTARFLCPGIHKLSKCNCGSTLGCILVTYLTSQVFKWINADSPFYVKFVCDKGGCSLHPSWVVISRPTRYNWSIQVCTYSGMCTLLASVHVNLKAVEGKSLKFKVFSWSPYAGNVFALLLAQLLCAACSLKAIHGEVHHQHSMVSVFRGVQQIPRLKLLHWCASCSGCLLISSAWNAGSCETLSIEGLSRCVELKWADLS